MDCSTAMGALAVFDPVFPHVKPPAINKGVFALITERLFPALARHISEINIFQAGLNTDLPGSKQGCNRRVRTVGQFVGGMKPADMPWCFAAQIIRQKSCQVLS